MAQKFVPPPGDDPLAAFPKRLADAMSARGYSPNKRGSIRAFAAFSGIDQGLISRYLGGKRVGLTVDTAYRLAKALGVPLGDLLTGEGREARGEALLSRLDDLAKLVELVPVLAQHETALRDLRSSLESSGSNKPAAVIPVPGAHRNKDQVPPASTTTVDAHRPTRRKLR